MKKEEIRNLYSSLDGSKLQQATIELLDLYLVQNKSLKQTAALMNNRIAVTKQKIAKAVLELRKASNDPDYLKAMQILQKK